MSCYRPLKCPIYRPEQRPAPSFGHTRGQIRGHLDYALLWGKQSSGYFDPSVQFLVNLWRFITKNVLCTAWHSFLSPGTQRWHSKSCSNESRLVVYQIPSFFTRYTCDHLGKTLTIVHVIEHWQKKHFFVCSLYRTEYSDNSVHFIVSH